MRVYAYLRASTKDQDAQRAKSELSDFAREKGLTVAAWFTENESGATLKRPELFRIIEIAQSGDVLLVEQVDRISRLTTDDWETLKKPITEKGIKMVCLNLLPHHKFIKKSVDFTERMM